MIQIGAIVDNKYKVIAVCSNSGGMGTILFVEDLSNTTSFRLVLKYCKDNVPESIHRFCRETRYLDKFKGSSKVVQIYDSNLEHNPPYFVMPYYPDGDLKNIAESLESNVQLQEEIFYKMIDCISELHTQGYQHRDIKPENFLRNGDDIIVSDLGLAKAVGAGTTFTRSSESWGTEDYIPPEFYIGDFKDASPPSDIFMLGKSFYCLLTKRTPRYLHSYGLNPAIFHVIENCCHLDKDKRYQTLPELKKALILAFDIILNRVSIVDRANQLLTLIKEELSSKNVDIISEVEVRDFLDVLNILSEVDRNLIIYDLPQQFFILLSKSDFEDKIQGFLKNYEIFAKDAVDSFVYAETIADYMMLVFDASSSNQTKRKALEIAIEAAIWANRFAAMDTCVGKIHSIRDENIGILVASLIQSYGDSFLNKSLNVSECQSNAVRIAVRAIQGK
jgi:serine/threonine protein kinase